MLNVTVICAFGDGNQVTVEVPYGATVADVASKVGAPSGCSYRSGGRVIDRTDAVGNGDLITISQGKADAGA
jgi:hypothetical protein